MKALTLTMIVVLAGCAGKVSQQTLAERCAPVKLIAPAPGCHQVADGMECEMNDLAPSRWGMCIQGDDRLFTCLSGGLISRYKHGPGAEWTVPAASCPQLTEQINKHGRDEEHIPLVVPVVPRTPTPASGKARIL